MSKTGNTSNKTGSYGGLRMKGDRSSNLFSVTPPVCELDGLNRSATGIISAHEITLKDGSTFAIESEAVTHPDVFEASCTVALGKKSTLELKVVGSEKVLKDHYSGKVSVTTDCGVIEMPYDIRFKPRAGLLWVEIKRLKETNWRLPRYLATLANHGKERAVVRSITCTALGEGKAEIIDKLNFPVALEPGDSISVEINFKPTSSDPENYTARLSAIVGEKSIFISTVIDVKLEPPEKPVVEIFEEKGLADWSGVEKPRGLARLGLFMLFGCLCVGLVSMAAPILLSWLLPVLEIQPAARSDMIYRQIGVAVVSWSAISLSAGFVFYLLEGVEGYLAPVNLFNILAVFVSVIIVLILVPILIVIIYVGGLITAVQTFLQGIQPWVLAVVGTIPLATGMIAIIASYELQGIDSLFVEKVRKILPWIAGIPFLLIIKPLAEALRLTDIQMAHTFDLYSNFGLITGLGMGVAVGGLCALRRHRLRLPVTFPQALGLMIISAVSIYILIREGKIPGL